MELTWRHYTLVTVPVTFIIFFIGKYLGDPWNLGKKHSFSSTKGGEGELFSYKGLSSFDPGFDRWLVQITTQKDFILEYCDRHKLF